MSFKLFYMIFFVIFFRENGDIFILITGHLELKIWSKLMQNLIIYYYISKWSGQLFHCFIKNYFK